VVRRPAAALRGQALAGMLGCDGADRPAPAALKLGIGLRRPCRGGRVWLARGMARVALTRHAAEGFSRTGLVGFSLAFQTAAPRTTKFDGG
jgi:hypothetical protein